MGIILRLNLLKSTVTSVYPESTSQPLVNCPRLAELLSSRGRVLIEATLPDSLSSQGYTYVQRTAKDPIPGAVTQKVPIRSISGVNTHFQKRVRNGEVLVSERQVGTIVLSSQAAYLESAVTGTSGRGWFFSKDLPSPGTINKYGEASNYPIIGGAFLYSFILVYDVTTIKGVSAVPAPPEGVVDFEDGYAILHPSLDPPPMEGPVTEALADANSKQWDLLTEMAELPEVFLFIRDSLEKIADVTSDFDRRRHSFIRAVGDDVALLASLWMAYRYAVMPLVYSIQDAISVFSDLPRRYAEYKVRSKTEIDAPDIDGWECSSSVEVEGRCFIKRLYDPMTFLEQLIDRVQFNVPATLWELSYRSFVVDWALNISDLIYAVTGDSSCSQEAATWSNRVVGSWDYNGGPRGSSQISFDLYHRTPINPIAHVGLSIGNHMTWKRAIDAAAMLYGPLRRKLRSLK